MVLITVIIVVVAVDIWAIMGFHYLKRRHNATRLQTQDTPLAQRDSRTQGDADCLPQFDTLFAPKTSVRVHQVDEDGQTDAVNRAGQPTQSATPDAESAIAGPRTSSLGQPQTQPAVPPPAYGLWRCSVRADPALLHWRANESSVAEAEPRSATPTPTYVERI